MGLDIHARSRGYIEASAKEEALWEAMADDDTESPKVDYPADEPTGPSLLHPDNICTPSYLRSSYNNGGFNSAAPRFLKDETATLYNIFEPLIGDDPEPYLVEVTDPGKVLLVQDRARDVAQRLRAVTHPLTTITVSRHMEMTEIAAIEWIEAQLAEERSGWMATASFTSREGYMAPTGLTIYGVTHGKRGETILVTKAEDEDGPWTRSYIASAEIVAEEFCQTLLDLIARDGAAFMTWSG